MDGLNFGLGGFYAEIYSYFILLDMFIFFKNHNVNNRLDWINLVPQVFGGFFIVIYSLAIYLIINQFYLTYFSPLEPYKYSSELITLARPIVVW